MEEYKDIAPPTGCWHTNLCLYHVNKQVHNPLDSLDNPDDKILLTQDGDSTREQIAPNDR